MLSPLLFVLEPLSREMRWRCSEDLILLNKSLVGSKGNLEPWKGTLDSKRLAVNVKKMEMMRSSERARKVRKERKLPCEVYWKSIGSTSIIYQFCKFCVHKRYNDIRGWLKQDDQIKCQNYAKLQTKNYMVILLN